MHTAGLFLDERNDRDREREPLPGEDIRGVSDDEFEDDEMNDVDEETDEDEGSF